MQGVQAGQNREVEALVTSEDESFGFVLRGKNADCSARVEDFLWVADFHGLGVLAAELYRTASGAHLL